MPLENRVIYSEMGINSDPLTRDLPGIAEQRVEESNQRMKESDESSSSFDDQQIQESISRYPQIRAKISGQLKKFNK